MNETSILSVVSRKLSPFMLLFGFYLVSFGHLTPGGGFQGGVVIASAFILMLLGQPPERGQRLVHVGLFGVVEAVSLMFFLLVGVAGIVAGPAFLSILPPAGSGGRTAHSGFILVLNVIIGMKVGAGVTVICYRLFLES